MKLRYIIPIIFLCMICLVSAAPPFTTQTVNGAAHILTIEYPPLTEYPLDNLTFHFHIFNSSGFLLLPAESDCNLHLYNNLGSHIIEEDLLNDGNNIDKYYNINETLLTAGESYAYIVSCEAVNESGFIATGFDVISSATSTTSAQSILLILFAILVIGMVILAYQFASLGLSALACVMCIGFGIMLWSYSILFSLGFIFFGLYILAQNLFT